MAKKKEKKKKPKTFHFTEGISIQTQHNISNYDYLDLYLWPPDGCKSNIYLPVGYLYVGKYLTHDC